MNTFPSQFESNDSTLSKVTKAQQFSTTLGRIRWRTFKQTTAHMLWSAAIFSILLFDGVPTLNAQSHSVTNNLFLRHSTHARSGKGRYGHRGKGMSGKGSRKGKGSHNTWEPTGEPSSSQFPTATPSSAPTFEPTVSSFPTSSVFPTWSPSCSWSKKSSKKGKGHHYPKHPSSKKNGKGHGYRMGKGGSHTWEPTYEPSTSTFPTSTPSESPTFTPTVSALPTASRFPTIFPTCSWSKKSSKKGKKHDPKHSSKKSGKGDGYRMGKGGFHTIEPTTTSAPTVSEFPTPSPTCWWPSKSAKSKKHGKGKGKGKGKGAMRRPSRKPTFPRPTVSPGLTNAPTSSSVNTPAPSRSTPAPQGQTPAPTTQQANTPAPTGLATPAPTVPQGQTTAPTPQQGNTAAPTTLVTPVPTIPGQTLAPTGIPTVQTGTSAPVAISDGVAATPFTVTYNGAGAAPSTADVDEATMITCDFLNDFLTAFFELGLDAEYAGLASCTQTSTSGNTITFDLSAGFGPNSVQPLPTAADIDVLIQTALSPPSSDALVASLGSTTGAFVGTTDTVYAAAP
jgi:hypothetical protein